MALNYEVWLNARHPKTLESVACVRVFDHADRLHAEAALERAHDNYRPVVAVLKTLQPGAVVNAEMRMPGADDVRDQLVAALVDMVDGYSMGGVTRAKKALAAAGVQS